MYKEQFEQNMSEFLKEKGYIAIPSVSYSDFEDFHYQTSMGFSLKKKYPDFEINELIEFLKKTGNYEKVELTGKGFVSLKCFLHKQNKYQHKPKTVLVDYCGVNVAKQMHIGHIRSMFIGDFIVRLHEGLGDKVIIHNHIGDWGNQFGFLLNYIKKNKLENNLTNKELTQYYKDAYLLYQNDSEFAKESTEIAYQLQNYLNQDIYDLWEKLVSISLVEAEKTFNEFNLKISLNDTKGESFYAPFCRDILNELIAKDIAKKDDDGSVLVFFENKSPLVLQKSNGNFLYALYDLAAIKWRVDNINPDKIVYVVDKRQSLHFEQVFEVAKAANFVNDQIELSHVGFGTILGKDKKPLKTKSGDSLYLDDLLLEGKERLLENTHFIEMDEKFKKEILNKTIIGGMKYYDLKFNKPNDYVFDWDHVLNFTGGSAPYIQNAIVRIDSIFYKKWGNDYDLSNVNWDHLWSTDEQSVLFQCQKIDEVINGLADTYASQQLTTEMIILCQLFHKYYENEKVLGAKDEKFKLQLLNYIQKQLIKCCNILGIEHYSCQNKLNDEYNLKNKQMKKT